MDATPNMAKKTDTAIRSQRNRRGVRPALGISPSIPDSVAEGQFSRGEGGKWAGGGRLLAMLLHEMRDDEAESDEQKTRFCNALPN
jgi:hypothetical protein